MNPFSLIRRAFARDPVTWREVGYVALFWTAAPLGYVLLMEAFDSVAGSSEFGSVHPLRQLVVFFSAAPASLAVRRIAPLWAAPRNPAHALVGGALAFLAFSLWRTAWTTSVDVLTVAIEAIPWEASRLPTASALEWLITSALANYWLFLVVAGYYTARAYRTRLSERERDAAALEMELARAQVETLRMQLNPHFLFNALNVISGLVATRPGQARDAIAQLSDLLRGALRGSTAEATLRDEVAWLERYLDLQRLRFDGRLDVDLDVPPEALDARVPGFLLQPLVENAFKHGVARVARRGRVTIHARRDDDRLVVDVLDNGPGLGDAGGGDPEGTGLGVATTRDRLARLYGDDARFEIADRADGPGVRARVALPYQTTRLPEAVPVDA